MSAIEVAIGPGPAGYRVDVVRSPAGEASATVTLDAEALLARRKELQHAVLASSVPTRRVLDETEQSIREVGQALFKALLGTGEVAGRYRAAAAVAAERQEGLRVVLRIDDPALAGLPWEAMYDDGAGTYVCRRDQLVRHVGVPAVVAPLAVTAPLRILGIVSSPRGPYPLDVEKEKDNLAKALAGNSSIQLTWAPSAIWADLQDVLQSGTWHVVHFIGHGDFDPDRDEGVLALTGEDGRKDVVEASRFVDLLHLSQPMPRLVVLNSCSGASTGITDLFSGTAAALVRGGVTAVAAMQYEITDQAAIAFARGFYGAIARGRGVDEAISSGRVAILGLSGKTLEWVTPVLYLRGNDSHLFTVPTPKPDPAHIPQHLVRTLTGHADMVADVAFSPDGKLLATASADKTARLWQPSTGRQLRTLTGHAGGVWGVAFSPDGALLATTSSDKTVRLWQPSTGTHVRTLTGYTHVVNGVAFSPDGTLLAITSADKTARLWQTPVGTWMEGEPTGGTQAGGDGERDIPLTPEDLRLLERVLASIYNTEERATAFLGQIRYPREMVPTWRDGSTALDYWWPIFEELDRGVMIAPYRRLLTTALRVYAAQPDLMDLQHRYLDTVQEPQVRTLTGHTGSVNGVAFSPDGTLLATTSSDKTARLWQTATGAHVRTLAGHTSELGHVAFGPDGTLLATASADQTVRLWQTATGTHLRTLTGHTDTVWDVAFSPDGTLLATASYDQTVRLWQAATGMHLRTLTGHANMVISVAFSPDGLLLASADADGTVRLWGETG